MIKVQRLSQSLRERIFSGQDAPSDVHNVRCRADHSRPVRTHMCILAPKRSSSPDRKCSRRRNRFHSCSQTHVDKLMQLQTSKLAQYKRYVQHCAICICRSVQTDLGRKLKWGSAHNNWNPDGKSVKPGALKSVRLRSINCTYCSTYASERCCGIMNTSETQDLQA